MDGKEEEEEEEDDDNDDRPPLSTQSSVTFDFSYLPMNWHQKHRLVKMLSYELSGPNGTHYAFSSLCIDAARYNRMNSIVMPVLVNGVSISHNKICQLCRCFFDTL